ncbi:hypothetical protein ABT288_49050 [Streptomyces sp. NPDC001093]|uniref:hypothetical protein n=1 Tax=Streptomyces sp. NPDC001093 TaxID=3154376 RepID=UPI0033319280
MAAVRMSQRCHTLHAQHDSTRPQLVQPRRSALEHGVHEPVRGDHDHHTMSLGRGPRERAMGPSWTTHPSDGP